MDNTERTKMVKAMEYIARHVNDENVFMRWLMGGVADGDIAYGDLQDADGSDDLECYIDDESFADLMSCFLRLMHSARQSGGLYCDSVTSAGQSTSMAVVCCDGSVIECRSVELANDKPLLILDGCRTVPFSGVLRIVTR